MVTGFSENQNKNKTELQRASPTESQGRSDEKHQILLFEAVAKGDYKKVKEYLDVIRDIDIKNEYGYTLLHWAVLMGQSEIASVFISRGANVNTTLPNGYTPLHDAAYWGKRNMVQLLIGHEADFCVIDKQGKIPLDLAVEQGHREIIPLLKPLHRAVENGDLSQVYEMVRKIPKSLNIIDLKIKKIVNQINLDYSRVEIGPVTRRRRVKLWLSTANPPQHDHTRPIP